METIIVYTQAFKSLIIDMSKKAKIWAICEPQNIFHSLVPADIFKTKLRSTFE